MERVAPGVRVVPVASPTLPPATHTNVAVLGQRRVTVVDPASPWQDEQAALLEALDAAGVEVARIVLTHHHADHVGGAEALRASLVARGRHVPVLAHAVTAALVAGDITVDALLADGDTLDCDGVTLQAVHTPGHAPGHLALHAADAEVIVAGDMVAGVGTILIDPREGDLGDYLASLERLRALGAARLIPAHGPVIDHADMALSFYVAHRHQRSAAIHTALGRLGRAAAAELVPLVYQDVPRAVWPMAAVQIEAHLRWLAAQGLCAVDGEAWRVA